MQLKRSTLLLYSTQHPRSVPCQMFSDVCQMCRVRALVWHGVRVVSACHRIPRSSEAAQALCRATARCYAP